MKNFFYEKFLLLCLLGVIPAISCTKETAESSETSCDVQTTLSETEALEQFSQVLSKAVFDNESLRSFIKEEALKQFDNDYDVFYPYVKNSKLSCGRTFRDVLLDYTDDEELKVIEYSLPKLTILVPDFSWVGENCFSVNTWDPSSNQISVGYDDRMDSHPIYVNGECGFELKANSFPSFPVLIVKSNERLNVDSPETKSSAAKYSFVDPVFDNSNSQYSTKSKHIEGDMENSVRYIADRWIPNDNFISASDLNAISPESIEAYNEFGSNNYLGGVQRDYIFYGMSRSNTNHGTLKKNMSDLLYRFSIDESTLFVIADNVSSSSNYDPNLGETYRTGRDDRPTFDQAVSRFWSDGKYEIKMEFYAVSAGVAQSIGSLTFNIAPSELMYISKCYFTFDWNFWGNNWSSYSLDSDCIISKWYYPGDKGRLCTIRNWNLATMSDDILIKIYENDNVVTKTTTESRTFKMSTSVKANASGTIAKKVDLGVSGEFSSENSQTYSVAIVENQGTDDVSEIWLNYVDNVIAGGYSYNSSYSCYGYQLEVVEDHNCTLCFIPIDTYKRTQIREILMNRKHNYSYVPI